MSTTMMTMKTKMMMFWMEDRVQTTSEGSISHTVETTQGEALLGKAVKRDVEIVVLYDEFRRRKKRSFSAISPSMPVSSEEALGNRHETSVDTLLRSKQVEALTARRGNAEPMEGEVGMDCA